MGPAANKRFVVKFASKEPVPDEMDKYSVVESDCTVAAELEGMVALAVDRSFAVAAAVAVEAAGNTNSALHEDTVEKASTKADKIRPFAVVAA